MTISLSSPRGGRLVCLALIAMLATACSSSPGRSDRPENPFKTAQEGPGARSPLSDRELREQAEELYSHARQALENAEYTDAIKRYDTLIARYPFSDFSTQAELEKMYAQYKSYQWDDVTTAADRFMRAHPRYPSADYVMYLKGVADFSRDQGLYESLLPNNAKRDIANQLRAYEDFALLIKRFPDSRYAGDARRRMLYSRNRIASHELSVAEFYITRGAYVAAAKRATDIISEYPGAPATAEALRILQRSYAALGLTQEAKDAATVIAVNTDTVQYTEAPKPGVMDKQPERFVVRRSRHYAGTESRWHRKTGRHKTPPPATGNAPAPTGSGTGAQSPAPAPEAPPAAPAPTPAPSPGNGPQSGPVNLPQAVMVAQADQAGGSTQNPGLMTKFAGMFSGLDDSKPENQHVFVIGGGSGGEQSKSAAVPAAAGNAAVPAGTTASSSNPSSTTPATPESTTPAAAPGKGHGFTLEYVPPSS